MQTSQNTDKELLQKLSQNDSQVVEQIYQQHYKITASWIYKYGGNEQDAADVCQESMVILYEKSQDESFRLTCKITTYLFAVAKNLWYKQSQRRKEELKGWDEESQQIKDETYDADISAHEEREMHYQQLDNALTMLGEPCSKILKAYYYGKKSMQQIAEEHNYTNADNAKTQKYKCLTRLKKIFYSTIVK